MTMFIVYGSYVNVFKLVGFTLMSFRLLMNIVGCVYHYMKQYKIAAWEKFIIEFYYTLHE